MSRSFTLLLNLTLLGASRDLTGVFYMQNDLLWREMQCPLSGAAASKPTLHFHIFQSRPVLIGPHLHSWPEVSSGAEVK